MVIPYKGRRLLQQRLFDHILRDCLDHLRQIGEVLTHGRGMLVQIGLEQIDRGACYRKGWTKFFSRIIVYILWQPSTDSTRRFDFNWTGTLFFCWLSILLHGWKCISHDCKGCKLQAQTYALQHYYRQILHSHSVFVACLHYSRYGVSEEHGLPHDSRTAQYIACSQPICPIFHALNAAATCPHAKQSTQRQYFCQNDSDLPSEQYSIDERFECLILAGEIGGGCWCEMVVIGVGTLQGYIVDECSYGEGEGESEQYYDYGPNLHWELINTPHAIIICHQIISKAPLPSFYQSSRHINQQSQQNSSFSNCQQRAQIGAKMLF